MFLSGFIELLPQVVRFLLVGGAGFLVDVCVLYTLAAIGVDPYTGRVISFLAAASFTWIGNRVFTFSRGGRSSGSSSIEWARYVSAMALGGSVNYTVYAALITFAPTLRDQPWLAVAAGTLSALVLNFLFARHLLYKGHNTRPVRS